MRPRAGDRSGLGGARPCRSTSPSESQRGDAVAFEGSTSTASITRRFEDLAAWLTAALTFPVGAVLLTGTGIVPDESFTLRPGDVVTIDIPGIGTLTNPVVLVGRTRPEHRDARAPQAMNRRHPPRSSTG